MCEKAWEEGVAFPEKTIEQSVYMNPSKPYTCRQNLEGTDKLVLVVIKRMDREGFLAEMKSRLLTAPPPLTEANRGVQTWMVYSNAKGKHQFVANKVFSFLEIGTNHSSMAKLVKPERVHAAGEFRIPTSLSKQHLNFQSGSYMVDIIRSPDVLKCGIDAYIKQAFEKMKPYFGGAEVDNQASTAFIGPEPEKKWTNIKQEELDRQKKWGADVYLFDQDEKRLCAIAEEQLRATRPIYTVDQLRKMIPRDARAASAPPPPPAPEPKPEPKPRKSAPPPPPPTEGVATRTRARKAAEGKGRRTRRKSRRFSTRKNK